jgi:hypothetical protein
VRISGSTVTRVCAVCERSLLMGEQTTRFSPDGLGDDYVDVCPLCQEIAADQGWVKEGTPTAPTMPRRGARRRPALVRLLAPRRPQTPPVVSEPILRRLSDSELAVVEAADLYNASDHRRSVAGIAKSLGEPRASIFRLPGVNQELVVTVAWDISWYQYRVTPDSPQPVRLAERGYDIGELDTRFAAWNARIEPDGRLVPNIERI